VQILPAGNDDQMQALAVMAEFERMAALVPDWDWARCAVIARVEVTRPSAQLLRTEGHPGSAGG
jgi:hypothetical protein